MPRSIPVVFLLFCFSWVTLQADPGETVIVLVGDSTVVDASPQRDQAGWGWALAKVAYPDVIVYNAAKGGRSSRSFRNEGLWEEALSHSPDWVMIQFGHNDQPGKGAHLESDVNTDYPQHLREYIADARVKGARVVLVTPVARRTFHSDGTLMDSLKPYADATKLVAEETGTPIVDLHARSSREYLFHGREWSTHLGPPNRPEDRTHFSQLGSEVVAGWVAEMLSNEAPELALYFNDSLLPTSLPALAEVIDTNDSSLAEQCLENGGRHDNECLKPL